jgi:acetyl esterase/lipase
VRTYGLILIVLFVVVGVASAQSTIPLWPKSTPESNAAPVPDKEFKDPGTRMVGGRGLYYIKEVSKPTLTVYRPTKVKDTGAASLVFPGGAYQRLAYDLEGTEVCDWLNSLGMTCVLVKYRVPFDKHYPDVTEDLEDAQQAMRITRDHAAEWHIDPQRIGATGFSAGAHLAVILGNHPDFKKEGAPETPESKIDARPNFVLVIYPGYLSNAPDLSKVTPSLGVSANTPPSFIVQTEDDGAHVENSLLYFKALKDAGVKAEMHLFAEGGHGYGLRPTEFPVSHWSALAETWFHTIHVLAAH